MKVDFKKALTYPFSEDKWIIKLLIGGLFFFIPVVNFLSIGYLMRILKATSEGKEPSLPEWGEWENLFKEGAFGFLIGLIYGIGISVVFILLSFLTIIPIIGCVFSLIQLLLMTIIAFLFPAWVLLSMIKYMQSGNFNDAFDFQGNYEKIKDNIADYGITALITGFINSACSIFCCLIIPSFYGSLVTFEAFGSLYYLTEHQEEAQEKPAESEAGEESKE